MFDHTRYGDYMKKIIKYSLCIITIFILLISTLTVIIPIPIIAKANYIEIYDINNQLIYTELYENKGDYTALSSLNDYTYNAFIAIEDKDFYNHSGFDFWRNIQAFFINLFSFSIKQGASTITQQYARNTLLSNKRNLSRKIKEAFYTIQIERKYSKDHILEGYLNSLYFGHGLIGISAASKYYFNKTPNELTIAESAMLAGLCNAPSIYSPNINEEKANQRQRLVLYQMFIQDYIDKYEYQQAIKENIEYYFIKESKSNINYYIDCVINQLTEENIYTKNNLQKGLKIYTTLDYSLHKQIDSIINKYKTNNEDTQISIVIMKPFSNNILYLTGGYDYNTSSYIRAINSSRQIGSTIKPLLYALALQNGFTPNTLLTSEATTFNIDGIGEYSPKNPNNQYANDEIDMIQAIALSDNIYALKTLLLLGSENFVELLNLFDIDNVEKLPSIALGTVNTSLTKLTSIYNTFASLGKYYKPTFVTSVTDYENNILYSNSLNSKTILDETNTLMLNEMLTSTFDSSLESYLTPTMSNYKTKNKYAAKSGTTNSDSYVLAFNPKYTIGVWAGSDSNQTFYNTLLSKQLFKEIASVLDNISISTWYSKNNQLEYKAYNPNTHLFNESSKKYLFKKV